jgi:hypothetical protein
VPSSSSCSHFGNDVGLLAEEFDHEQKRLVGNFPQALSHLGLINRALLLSGTRFKVEDNRALRASLNLFVICAPLKSGIALPDRSEMTVFGAIVLSLRRPVQSRSRDATERIASWTDPFDPGAVDQEAPPLPRARDHGAGHPGRSGHTAVVGELVPLTIGEHDRGVGAAADRRVDRAAGTGGAPATGADLRVPVLVHRHRLRRVPGPAIGGLLVAEAAGDVAGRRLEVAYVQDGGSRGPFCYLFPDGRDPGGVDQEALAGPDNRAGDPCFFGSAAEAPNRHLLSVAEYRRVLTGIAEAARRRTRAAADLQLSVETHLHTVRKIQALAVHTDQAGMTVVYLAAEVVARRVFLILVLALALPGWAAALIVTAIWAASGLLALQGRSKLQEIGKPVPEKTVESVKEDVWWLKDRT